MNILKKFLLTTTCSLALLLSSTKRTYAQESSIKDTTGISTLRKSFARTALGEELLNLCDKNNVKIYFDSALAKKEGAIGCYHSENKNVILMSRMSEEQQVITLAHELRHAWQDFALHYSALADRTYSPLYRFAIYRYIEADAAAFSAYFYADRMNLLHIKIDSVDIDGSFETEKKVAKYIKKDISLNVYRETVLVKCFVKLNGVYDLQHKGVAGLKLWALNKKIDTIDSIAQQGARGLAKRKIKNLFKEVAKSPSLSEITAYLRGFGAPSLDPQARTSLANDTLIKTSDLLYNYPFRRALPFFDTTENPLKKIIESRQALYEQAIERLNKKTIELAQPFARRQGLLKTKQP